MSKINSNIFKVQLSTEQARVLQQRLPKGYNIFQTNRPNKRESARNALIKGRKDVSDESSQQQGRQRKKPQNFNDDEIMNRAPKSFTQEQRKCFLIMQKLRRHPSAPLFFKQQDQWKNNEQVKDLIDLLMIEQNVKHGLYSSILQFWADVRKIWQYTYLSSPKESEIYLKTVEMENYFDELYREAEKPIQKNNLNDLQKKVEKLTKELSYMNQQKSYTPTAIPQTQPQKRHHSQYMAPTLPVRKQSKTSKSQSKLEVPMTIQEKKNLGMNIRTLPPECLKGVWEIVSDGLNIQNAKEELEFDIDTLAVKKTRLLERFVNGKLQQINRQNQRNQQQQQQSHQSQFAQQSVETIKSQQSQPVVAANFAWPTAAPENDTAESSFSSDAEDSI